MSLALAAAAAGLAYRAATVQPSPPPEPRELREAFYCGDGCDFDIAREFPCACPSDDDEVTP